MAGFEDLSHRSSRLGSWVQASYVGSRSKVEVVGVFLGLERKLGRGGGSLSGLTDSGESGMAGKGCLILTGADQLLLLSFRTNLDGRRMSESMVSGKIVGLDGVLLWGCSSSSAELSLKVTLGSSSSL